MRVAAIALLLFAQPAAPPGVGQIQSWYEAGRYQEIVDQAQQTANPMGIYLVASSYERLDRFDEARAMYQRLVARGGADPWALIGRSASALVGGVAPAPEAVEEAFLAAQEAVALLDADPATGRAAANGPVATIAHYQAGLVHAFRDDYSAAAVAFEAARTHDPGFAYAYYYGGQAHSRLERPDQMAINFERFLQIAPEAPEARRVQSLMRSVRGR